jgi:AcrR family transcriptional regulator
MSNREQSPEARRPGRPRTVSDDEIYTAAVGVLAAHGSRGLTLARVAVELGITPAAVRQRLGSKRGLLLEMARRRASGVEAGFAAARAAYESKLDALEAALLCRMEGFDDPERLAKAMSVYSDNAGDPEMRAFFHTELTEVERCIGELLEEAAAAGEISRPVTPELVSVVFMAFEGALTVWSLAPRGRVEERVGEALAVLLGTGPAGYGD